MSAILASMSHELASAGLAVRLSEALRLAGVRHCAWKADPRVERFERGEGDLDLLVDRARAGEFAAAIAPFGFRPAVSSAAEANPGLVSYFAPHPEHGGLVHLHAHLRLVIGSASRLRYHLPVERAVLETSRTRAGLRVAAPEVATILAVLHATLRTGLRDSAVEAARRDGLDRALGGLARGFEPRALRLTLGQLCPELDPALFEQCRAALHPHAAQAARIEAAMRLHRALRGHRVPWQRPLLERARRRLRTFAGALRDDAGSPSSGGCVIALVGPDGAGKSTCARLLAAWLGSVYGVAHLHLGRPPRGILTYLVGGALKVARALDRTLGRLFEARLVHRAFAHLELARAVCTARDRRRVRDRAGRLAASGAIVICERVPVGIDDPLAGASAGQGIAREARSALAERLRAHERACYRAIAPADLTLVLRLPPELAVLRKPEEPADYVHRRAQLVWEARWDRPAFRVVDAARPLPEVMRDLRAHVWQAL